VSETQRPRIGVRFEPDWAPEELPAFAREVERLGYDDLWFSEDLPWAGGIAMAATALACTERLRVGLGLLPAVTRNVATTAMELGALARIAPGRLVVALGTGVPAWMEQIGAPTNRRLAALAETMQALRQLLRGESVTADGGHVALQDVALGFPPASVPPILVGATGPMGMTVAAGSEGLLLPELATPAAVRWARAAMTEAGATGETALFTFLSIDDDREEALRQVRSRAQRLIDFQIFPRLMELAGVGADGGREMTDKMLQSFAVAGTPADCSQTVADLASAGASCIVFVAGSSEYEAHVRRFAEVFLGR
jgi:5,10-methylenetetrahydromethanopterin reductase